MDAAAHAPISRQRLAFEAGLADTRVALRSWLAGGMRDVAPWAAGSLAIGLLLLAGALAIATVAGHGSRVVLPIFADDRAGAGDAMFILARNTLVLLLHCLVCLGTYLAVRSVPLQARRAQGTDRVLREVARPLALTALAGFTLFSLGTQVWVLGHDLASAAWTLGLSDAGLLARLSLHAAPELTAVFLPLSACLALARRGRYDDLAAAALLTGALAFPVVVAAACCEVWLTRVLL